MRKIHLLIGEEDLTFCGKGSEGAVSVYLGFDVFDACKTCQRAACPDCGGTGHMGGGTAGIYCQCEFGTIAELEEEQN